MLREFPNVPTGIAGFAVSIEPRFASAQISKGKGPGAVKFLF